ncbi:MAG: MscS family membrane protein [Myxococcota bacterium]|jgi:MscS family membrane protein
MVRVMLRALLAAVVFAVALLAVQVAAASGGPLAPLKTDHPRDTMASFMAKMNEYRASHAKGDGNADTLLGDAARCFDVSSLPVLQQREVSREAAIFLKETIDRVILINLSFIPEATTESGAPVERWRLKDTEIVIHVVKSGDREGEFLFTPDTTARADDFYDKVRQLPYLKGSGMGAGYKGPWLKRNLPAWTHQTFISLAWWQWAALTLALFVGLLMRNVAIGLGKVFKRAALGTETEWDDVLVDALAAPAGFLAATGIWYASLRLLQLKDTADTILAFSIKVLFYVALTFLAYRFATVVSDFGKKRVQDTDLDINVQLINLMRQTVKIVAVVFCVLLAAQNMGIDVFSLIAGLGIGGLAVALAAKDSLANFFGSVMIMLDQPFRIGDWVVVKSSEGTVEEIGFRSTKIRTFYNSVINIPNSDVVMAHVDNLGVREYRRTVTTLGVTYDTPPEMLEAFMEGIKNIINANEFTRKDYFHIVFKEFGPSSLDIMLYFFFKCPDWSTELVERQNVYLEILRLSSSLGISFAYPTQSLHLETVPDKEPIRKPHDVDLARYAEVARGYGTGGLDSKPKGLGLFVAPFKEVLPGEAPGGGDEG